MNAAVRPVWIGIDLGTQSVRAMAVTDAGEVLGAGASPLAGQRDGVRHEQHPGDWWTAVGEACRQALAGIAAGRKVGGVAVCGTSGTMLLTDEAGEALTPGLMYDDARAAAEADRVNEQGGDLWQRLGYRRIQTVWALPKLLWLLGNTAPAKGRRLAHQADYITGKLAGRPLRSDLSNALKTGCDTIDEGWDMALMERLGVPAGLLPELVRPGTVIGTVDAGGAGHTGIPAGTPIVAGMTDGCASQISSGATAVGSWNSVLGTTLVLKGTSGRLVRDPNGIIYSHRSPDGQWLPGGASSSGAGALTRALPGADLAALSAAAESHGPGSQIAYPLSAESGERFPFIAPDARPFVLGETDGDPLRTYLALTQGIAAIERLCFDYLDLLGFPTDGMIALTGGTVRNRQWNRARATMLGRALVAPRVAEPAFGMAVLASSIERPLTESTAAMVQIDRIYEPETAHQTMTNELYLSLVAALENRGWLPPATATHAIGRAGQ